jgi:hypothetical protein
LVERRAEDSGVRGSIPRLAAKLKNLFKHEHVSFTVQCVVCNELKMIKVKCSKDCKEGRIRCLGLKKPPCIKATIFYCNDHDFSDWLDQLEAEDYRM